jgi:hypothetical protein
MDLGSALVLDYEEDTQYYVQVATKEYCSPKFLHAFTTQTPLTSDDLILEDHYQMLRTLEAVCEGRKDLTEHTKFMLECLRKSKSIEEAMNKIARKLDLTYKIFSQLQDTHKENGVFAMSFLGNLNPNRYREFNFKSIKLLLQQKPFDLARQLLDYSISYLYPYF